MTGVCDACKDTPCTCGKAYANLPTQKLERLFTGMAVLIKARSAEELGVLQRPLLPFVQSAYPTITHGANGVPGSGFADTVWQVERDGEKVEDPTYNFIPVKPRSLGSGMFDLGHPSTDYQFINPLYVEKATMALTHFTRSHVDEIYQKAVQGELPNAEEVQLLCLYAINRQKAMSWAEAKRREASTNGQHPVREHRITVESPRCHSGNTTLAVTIAKALRAHGYANVKIECADGADALAFVENNFPPADRPEYLENPIVIVD